MSKYSTQVHCAWFITVQQITVIMQQILQIMEKPGRMEKVWKNCWGLRRIWENISALSPAAADGSIFVGADLSPDRDNENAQTTADSGEEDSAYDNLKMEFSIFPLMEMYRKLIPEIRFSLPIHFRHVSQRMDSSYRRSRQWRSRDQSFRWKSGEKI